MKEKLLFMTTGTSQADEGLDYVLQLAKTMQSGVAIVISQKKSLSSIYDDIMSSITFAEEGQQDTAMQILDGESEPETGAEAVQVLRARCAQHMVEPSIHLMTGDPLKSVERFVKDHDSIEMVFLSPSLSSHKDIKKVLKQQLLKRIDKPVVTIRRLTETTT